MWKRMKRQICFWTLAALFLPVFFSPPMAHTEPAGVIRGKITNGTTGGTKVSEVEVILYLSGESQEEFEKTKTNKEGLFSFSGLSIEKEKSYYVKANYKGVEYFSPTISFEGKKELRLDLTVYETTDKDANVYVKMHHVFMNLEKSNLWVKEVMILENRGNRVYVGFREIEPQKREVLRITLPKNSMALELSNNLMECCIVKTEDGFVDTMDIKPGLKEIAFTYQIDYGSSRYNLSKAIYAKTESINFFVPEKEIGAKSDVLQFRGSVGDRGKRFLHFAGRDLTPGSQIVLELSGLPQGRRILKYAILALVFIAVGGGFAYPFLRKRKQATEAEEQRGYSIRDQREELLQKIADLDEQFKSHGIDSEEYRSTRKELVEKAVMITRQMRKGNEV